MKTFTVPLNKLYAVLITYNKKTKQRTLEYDIKSVSNSSDPYTKKSMTKLINTPHYKFLKNRNDKSYKNYLIKGGEYVGYGLEHSVEKFENLIENFKGYPYQNEYIKCKIVNKRLCISDGLHRANILLLRGNKNDKVTVIVENSDYITKTLKNKKQLKLKQEQKMREEFEKLRIKVDKKS